MLSLHRAKSFNLLNLLCAHTAEDVKKKHKRFGQTVGSMLATPRGISGASWGFRTLFIENAED